MVTAAQKIEFILRREAGNERRTTYQLAIAIDSEVVWPVRGELAISLEIQVDDLLAYLTEFWKPLMLRQVYPVAVSPFRPSDLRRYAEQRWADMPPAAVEKEDELVSSFEEAHDLTSAFGGLFGLPHFWMMRSAEQMIVETAGTVWRLPFEEVRKCLRTVGDNICQILETVDSAHWDAAIDAWRVRDNSDPAVLLVWSASIDQTIASALIADHYLDAPRDFDDAANDDDELRIAARIAGALPLEQIKRVLSLAREFENHKAPKLALLAEQCRNHIVDALARKPPHAQGEAAALFVRRHLEVTNDRALDIFAVADDLGIAVKSAEAIPSSFDGLAIWGSKYGPGVFLNERSQRVSDYAKDGIKSDPGARITLAHELCHLLLDGEHAVSAIEVLKARMPAGVEARARAFAGELLLPTEAAARAWNHAGRPTNFEDVRKIVSDLSEEFKVTWSVAAWKLQHGAGFYGWDLESVLDLVAPYR